MCPVAQAPEPETGLRRLFLSPETRLRARLQTAGRYGLRRRIGRTLPALAAAAFLLLAPPLAIPSFAQVVGTAPSAPQNLTAAPDESQVTLRWDAPEDDGGAGTVFYEYSYWETGQSSETVTPSGSNPIATVHGLTNGTEYAFEVRARNKQGSGAAVAITAIPMRTPSAPQNLLATPGDGQVALFWNAPAREGGVEIAG